LSHFTRKTDLSLLGAALLVGVALDVLTWLLARSGPEGGGGAPWSLRGNGALIVPFGLGPALLAGVWSALVLHARASERWRLLSGIMALIGVLIPLAGLLALIAFGATYFGQVTASWLFIGTLAWAPLAAVLAAVVPLRRRPLEESDRLQHFGLGLGMTVLLVTGLMAGARLLPPGS
jgi:hypothetical protein